MLQRLLAVLAAVLCCLGQPLIACAHAATLSQTAAVVKKSVVGVGTYQKMRSPAIVFVGTGFVVGDGLSVITNAHVIPELVNATEVQSLGIVLGSGNALVFREAELAGMDREHDLAHLRLKGAPLPALSLGEPDEIQEGNDLAFTGFPLGMSLGLHPATHRALLSAITPVVLPSLNSRRLAANAISQLQRQPFPIYQLDATAYPGNSGSPVYDPATGVVHAVINMVFIKSLKEGAISSPSGITYAVPARHVRDLLQQKSPHGK